MNSPRLFRPGFPSSSSEGSVPSTSAKSGGVRLTNARIDPAAHSRFLDYRELHAYFGNRLTELLTMAAFLPLDTEYVALAAKGDKARDDEEEARFEELAALLFRD